jgi:hypothetical protein
VSAEVSKGIRVVGIVARVELQSDTEKQEMIAALRRSPSAEPDVRERVVAHTADASMYKMYTRLAATLSDGRQLSTRVRDFSRGAPRHGVAAIHHRYRG